MSSALRTVWDFQVVKTRNRERSYDTEEDRHRDTCYRANPVSKPSLVLQPSHVSSVIKGALRVQGKLQEFTLQLHHCWSFITTVLLGPQTTWRRLTVDWRATSFLQLQMKAKLMYFSCEVKPYNSFRNYKLTDYQTSQKRHVIGWWWVHWDKTCIRVARVPLTILNLSSRAYSPIRHCLFQFSQV